MATYTGFKILLPPLDASALKMLTYAKSGYTGLTTNAATFAEPPITMVVYKAKIDALEASMVAKNISSEVTRELTNKHRLELREMLVKLAAYVIGVANGDRYTASLSGFTLSKEVSETRPQTNFTIKNISIGTLPGTADITIGARGGNDMFKVYLKVGDDYVMHDAFTGKNYRLTGLPSGSNNIRIIGFKSDVAGPVVDTVANAF